MRKSTSSCLLLGAVIAACMSFARASAGPIEQIPPGQWYEVPNSNLRQVVPNPVPPGIEGPGSVVTAWSGGAYDTKRDRLLVWGGGHSSYGGNEIYAFDLNTLAWSRIWGPSTDIPDVGGLSCGETYSDGNPRSRHTYDGLEYLPDQDQFWIQGGSLYCGSGGSRPDTWVFDFAGNRWIRKANIPVCDVCSWLEDASAYDPVTKHVWLVQSGLPLMEYDPVNDTWTERSNSGIGSFRQGALDWRRRKFVIIGDGAVFSYDISQSGTIDRQTLNTTGDTSIINPHYPGLAYDPVADLMVAWDGGGDVYTLNLDSLVWTRHPSTGPVVPTPAPSTGTYGRFRYVPSKDVFVTVNSIDENVYVYRLSAGGTPAPTDSIPPSAPPDLRPH